MGSAGYGPLFLKFVNGSFSDPPKHGGEDLLGSTWLACWSSVGKAIAAQPIDGKQRPVSCGGQAVVTDMALFNAEPHELQVENCFLRGRKEEWFVAGSLGSRLHHYVFIQRVRTRDA